MSNEITRYNRNNPDIHRQGGQTGNDAGGSGGGQHGGAPESAAVREIRAQISKITRLAHSGKAKDEEQYRERQGELQGLMRQLVAAQGGGSVATTDAAPSSPAAYGNLPVDSVYREAWSDAKPALQEAGITTEQARLLGQAVLRAEMEGQERAAAAVQQRRADTKRSLSRLYGSGWERDVKRGNDRARELLPDGAAKQLFSEQLADGSILGDHEMICRLMIELARQ